MEGAGGGLLVFFLVFFHFFGGGVGGVGGRKWTDFNTALKSDLQRQLQNSAGGGNQKHHLDRDSRFHCAEDGKQSPEA